MLFAGALAGKTRPFSTSTAVVLRQKRNNHPVSFQIISTDQTDFARTVKAGFLIANKKNILVCVSELTI